ncbi:MAG TPA: hypothetical protein VFW50_17855 [Streptosporangiaceae bacterium]|nr:hypothetical protein [Streptosporangiaceae bacterium]
MKTPSSNFASDVWMNPVFSERGWTPAAEEHVHGGTAENTMCHYEILDAAGDGEATTWLEPVTDEQYLAAQRTAGV